jgi:DNA-binding NarL/FixJ family response regulator
VTRGRIRVALAVEAGRLREVLHAILRTSDRLQVESTLSAAADLDMLGLDTADALVCDDTRASLELAQLAHAAGVAVVVITDDPEVAASLRELRSGLGLLPTRATAEEVLAAIEAAGAGLFAAHPDLIDEGERPGPPGVGVLAESLTPREVEVLHALAAGLGNKAIARELRISEHTAKFHVSQILAKLGAGSRAEAVSIAMRRGLLPL